MSNPYAADLQFRGSRATTGAEEPSHTASHPSWCTSETENCPSRGLDSPVSLSGGFGGTTKCAQRGVPKSELTFMAGGIPDVLGAVAHLDMDALVGGRTR